MSQSAPTVHVSEDRKLSAFGPIRVRSAPDEVLAILVDAIRGGLFAPGELLPPERDLAAQLGISRTVLREALAALRQAGILRARRGQGGMMIASLSNIGQVLSRIAGETRFELLAVLEVRRMTEPVAAQLASLRAGPKEIARLTGMVEQLVELAGKDREFYEADVRFHLALGELSGNAMLAQMVREVFTRLGVLREPFPHGHVDFTSAIVNQRQLLAAIVSRDRHELAEAVEQHLAAFEQVMLGRTLTGVSAFAYSSEDEEG